MNNKIQKIEELLSGLNYSFSTGFSARLMDRIMRMEQTLSPSYYLSAGMSRFFYCVNIPGLAVTVVLLILVLLSGDFSPVSFKSQYTMTFTEFLNDYYYHLIK